MHKLPVPSLVFSLLLVTTALFLSPLLQAQAGQLQVVGISPTSNFLTAPVNTTISVNLDEAVNPATVTLLPSGPLGAGVALPRA